MKLLFCYLEQLDGSTPGMRPTISFIYISDRSKTIHWKYKQLLLAKDIYWLIFTNFNLTNFKFEFLNKRFKANQLSLVARSKAWVCSRSLAGIVGSNHARGMEACLWSVLCVIR